MIALLGFAVALACGLAAVVILLLRMQRDGEAKAAFAAMGGPEDDAQRAPVRRARARAARAVGGVQNGRGLLLAPALYTHRTTLHVTQPAPPSGGPARRDGPHARGAPAPAARGSSSGGRRRRQRVRRRLRGRGRGGDR